MSAGCRITTTFANTSTAEDLLRFTEALTSERLLPRPLLDEATRLQAECCDGYGFSIFGQGARRWIGPDGGSPGANASLRMYSELGYTLIVLSNLDPPSVDDLGRFFEQTILLNAGHSPPRARVAESGSR